MAAFAEAVSSTTGGRPSQQGRKAGGRGKNRSTYYGVQARNIIGVVCCHLPLLLCPVAVALVENSMGALWAGLLVGRPLPT